MHFDFMTSKGFKNGKNREEQEKEDKRVEGKKDYHSF